MTRRVAILGAAGRDYHDFNTFFRGNEDFEVVAFLQIRGQNVGELDEFPERTYPSSLAGEGYDEGIPILPADRMEEVVEEEEVDEIVLSYSDVSHEDVMHQASRALSLGCGFRLIGPGDMQLESEKPVIAVDAVRTGCGKSQASRKIADILQEEGVEVVVVREPMPYGDLEDSRVQRFETMEDIDEAGVTIEEREEYEQHVERGHVVYAGVDYEEILERAEGEAEVVLWEGGNNELPFFQPDLHFVLADPHRPGHEVRYHPGEANLRTADYVIINKENTAEQGGIDRVVENVEKLNPGAEIVHADSEVTVENPDAIEGKKAVVVEDGPTVTHGGTKSGAGLIAAEKYGASEVVDPRDYVSGTLKKVMEEYELKDVIPAMGYSQGQVEELEEALRRAEADVVVSGTPHDLSRLLDVGKPVVRAQYRIEERNVTFREILGSHPGISGL